MFGKFGTWWDHRPLWQKIGLGVVGAVGAGLGAGALLGGGAGAAAGGAGAATAGEAGLGAGTAAAGATEGAGALAGLSGVTPEAAEIKSIAAPSGFRAMLAAHPGVLKYGKLAAGQGVNMYQDMAAKKEAERQRRQQLAMYLMQMQGPGAFPTGPTMGGGVQ